VAGLAKNGELAAVQPATTTSTVADRDVSNRRISTSSSAGIAAAFSDAVRPSV
jgi:hypothetical protein